MRIAGVLFILLCWVKWASAQELDIHGSVVDKKTGAPIPYVNFSFINTLKGTSSDEQGRYLLSVDRSFLDKRIYVSCLGYKDSVVMASELSKTNRFFLIPESYELNEVLVLGEDLSNQLVINPIGNRSLTSGFVSTSTPWILATHFNKPEKKECFIKKVKVFYKRSASFGDFASKFRIRIFDTDPDTGFPTKDLIRENIIVQNSPKEEAVLVDLSKYGIKVPENGFYIGLEWLFIPSNWYKEVISDPLTEKTLFVDRFAPTFAGVFRSVEQNKTMVYSMGVWSNFTITSKDNQKKLAPAVSITLSH